MKIAVIFTGGTIGSALSGDWVCLDDSLKQTLINNYVNKYGNDVKFDILNPYSISSENLSGKELTTLIKCVNECLKEDYDGVIVTHGTDTIQYTAAALSYTLEITDIPVVIVSANYPLNSEKSNGNINFEAAVSFIKSKAGSGVFVSYKNTLKDATSIHYGTRLLTHVETFDDLYSIDSEPYAYYEDNKVIINNEFKPVKNRKVCRNVKFKNESDILVISSHPADSFNYNLEKFRAVILTPYHSATLNTDNINLINFCKRAKNLQIPVFLVNLRVQYIYESSKIFDELNLVKLPLCCFAAIYTKLWLALSCSYDIISFMNEEICGEFLENWLKIN